MTTATPQPQTLRYGAYILLECLLWGFGNPAIKLGLASLTPFYCLGLRFSLAFVCFLLLYRRRIFAGLNRRNLGPCLLICLTTAVCFAFATFALMLTSATVAGFLMCLAVIFTPFLAFLLGGQKPDRKIYPIMAVVVLGLYLLCGSAGGFRFGWGELFCLLSSLTFAISLSLSEKYLADLRPATLSAMQAAVTAVLCLLLAVIFEDAAILARTTALGWGCVVYLALGCTVAAYLLQNVALSHLSAVFVSLAFCSEPIFSALAARLLLDERLSAWGLVGAALIMLGLVLAAWLPYRAQQQAEQRAQ